MKKVLVKNVVLVNHSVVTTYPQWSDYGCLTNAISVVYKDGDAFKEITYVTEQIVDGEEAYDVEIEPIANIEKEQELYKEFLLSKKVEQSKKDGHSFGAIAGDIIEVYKGRKYPIGTRFVVKNEYVYRGMYGRALGYYWRTTTGELVPQQNCIIVGSEK